MHNIDCLKQRSTTIFFLSRSTTIYISHILLYFIFNFRKNNYLNMGKLILICVIYNYCKISNITSIRYNIMYFTFVRSLID